MLVTAQIPIYTQRAHASWAFDGSGTFAGAGVGTFGTWTQTGTGNTGDASSVIITTGVRVPVTTGVIANTALRGASLDHRSSILSRGCVRELVAI